MRFWITRNSELSVREQLVRQVILGILSEDLPAGRKLPSVRALARRHRIHANTVSAAYHELLQQGWLEARRGSGLYVRLPFTMPDGSVGLDQLLATFLQSARSHGYEPSEVLQRLENIVRPRTYERVLIIEPDPAMREILHAELAEHLGARVDSVGSPDFNIGAQTADFLAVALPTRAAQIRRGLPRTVLCIPLRLNSVGTMLEGQTKPGPNVLVSVASRSTEIRHWARTMLIAVGLAPEALTAVDTTEADWRERFGSGAVIVTDLVTGRELASDHTQIFRVIADSSINELRQFCGL